MPPTRRPTWNRGVHLALGNRRAESVSAFLERLGVAENDHFTLPLIEGSAASLLGFPAPGHVQRPDDDPTAEKDERDRGENGADGERATHRAKHEQDCARDREEQQTEDSRHAASDCDVRAGEIRPLPGRMITSSVVKMSDVSSK
jgi:hypothetical protein